MYIKTERFLQLFRLHFLIVLFWFIQIHCVLFGWNMTQKSPKKKRQGFLASNQQNIFILAISWTQKCFIQISSSENYIIAWCNVSQAETKPLSTLKLPRVIKTEFLLTISRYYQADKWWELTKITMGGLLVDLMPNSPT